MAKEENNKGTSMLATLKQELSKEKQEEVVATEINPTFSQPKIQKPEPIDKEIELDPKRYIVSKTDPKGIIEYGNEYFVEISGYQEHELIGQPHNIIRHPDMPKIIFRLMWERISEGENIVAMVKNLSKSGRYYWVITDFDTKINKFTGEIESYYAYRKAAPKHAIKKIEPLYQKLLKIEKESGIEGARKYLVGYLETQNKTYDQFIEEITEVKGLAKFWFRAMKKLFGHK